MKSGILIGAVVFGLLLCIAIRPAQAQRQYRRYSPPAGPVFSPQFNLLREDTGVIGDPYNAFVVPRRQLDNQLRYMARQQQTDVRAARQQLDQIRRSESAPTGSGATFMNYSHFYRMNSQTAGNLRGR